VNEHAETVRVLAPVVMKLLSTYEHLWSCDATSSSSSYVSRRDAELFLTSNKDRLTTMLTRTLTSAAQQAAGADNSQQADIYLKAGSSLGRLFYPVQSVISFFFASRCSVVLLESWYGENGLAYSKGCTVLSSIPYSFVLSFHRFGSCSSP